MARFRGIRFALIALLVAVCQLSAAEMNKTGLVQSSIKLINAANLGRLSNPSLGELTALCELDGKTYGAGSGKVVLLDDSGAVTRSIPVDITEVGGIAPFTGKSLIIGDYFRKTLFKLDTETGKLEQLLWLPQINTTGFPAGNIIRDGQLAGVAFDGTNVYIACNAGFSSSIFKLDIKSNKILAHGWSPGQDTFALGFSDGVLVALSRDGKEIRPYNPATIKQTYEVIPVSAKGINGIIIKGTAIKVLSTAEKAIIKLQTSESIKIPDKPTVNVKVPDVIKTMPEPKPVNKYAVLVCGDVAESGYYYDCFWNDTVWMYKTLLAAGFTKEDIYVLYGNGYDYPSANPAFKHPGTVTDFPATISYLNRVLDGMVSGDAALGIARVTDKDTLFIWTSGHGAGGDTVYLCLMDGWYLDSDLSARINAIPCYRRPIFMQQCHSGGFVPFLNGPQTFISTSCGANGVAYVSENLREAYGGKHYHHGTYSYHIISALGKKTPNGIIIKADSNADGKVTVLECHKWAADHVTDSESPICANSSGIGTYYCIYD